MSKLLSKEELEAAARIMTSFSPVNTGLLEGHIIAQEQEIERLRGVLAGLNEGAEKWLKRLETGCGNHGCVINPPKGQGTNMICQCLKLSTIRRDVRWVRDVSHEALNQEVKGERE